MAGEHLAGQLVVPHMVRIGTTDLDIFPLQLGGNVFGWTSDEQESFAVLDSFADAGGNSVDTADVYSRWVPGHSGGESEAILGRWMASRGNRDQMVVATKMGALEGLTGLGPDTIARAVEGSLRRLQTDRIDLYYAHRDDEGTAQEETLAAFDALVQAGKVRHLGASNFSADRLASALKISQANDLARYEVVQDRFNLMERDYATDLAPVVAEHGLGSLPYSGLASGFLTGKYRPDSPLPTSPRAAKAAGYLEGSGRAVLAALDEVAADRRVSPAAVALAWLRQQDTVTAPIASARTPEQLPDLLSSAALALTPTEQQALTAAL